MHILCEAKFLTPVKDISVPKPVRTRGTQCANTVYNRILKLQGSETPFELLGYCIYLSHRHERQKKNMPLTATSSKKSTASFKLAYQSPQAPNRILNLSGLDPRVLHLSFKSFLPAFTSSAYLERLEQVNQ